MTFDSRFCEDVFDTLGRDHTLRHAYRVYLWRRALTLGPFHRPLTDENAEAGAELRSVVQASIPPGDQSSGFNAGRTLSFPRLIWS